MGNMIERDIRVRIIVRKDVLSLNGVVLKILFGLFILNMNFFFVFLSFNIYFIKIYKEYDGLCIDLLDVEGVF